MALLWPLPTVAADVAPPVPTLSEAVGSGWVSSHSARAGTAGSIPAFFHQATSSPQRWTSRWWPRHSGTVNSSLTFARARGAARTADDGHRRACGRRSGRLFGHELTWVLSRKRRGSGWTNWLLSMPLATDVPRRVLRDRRSTDEDGRSADKTGDKGASLMSAALPSDASLARNASSTCWASAAIRLFFAPKIRCAQLVASSAEAMRLSSASKSIAQTRPTPQGSRIGLAGCETAFTPRAPDICWAECLDRH